MTRPSRLTVRVGSHQIYLTAESDDGRADVLTVPRAGGASKSVQLDEIDATFADAIGATSEEDKILNRSSDGDEPPRTRDMSAEDAITLIRSGESFDLDGEDRKTVLEAAENGSS